MGRGRGVDVLIMDSVNDLFQKLGGPSEVARILGCGTSTASEMKRRSSVPIRYWTTLIQSERGRDLGLTSDLLVHVHEKREAAE